MSNQTILFLMGTLEKSKCGVSDYIHMLVDRLSEEGHSCVCLAINDINLLDDDFSAYSSKNNGGYSFYRFSSSLDWSFRLKELKKIIKLINPNIISLHIKFMHFTIKAYLSSSL